MTDNHQFVSECEVSVVDVFGVAFDPRKTYRYFTEIDDTRLAVLPEEFARTMLPSLRMRAWWQAKTYGQLMLVGGFRPENVAMVPGLPFLYEIRALRADVGGPDEVGLMHASLDWNLPCRAAAITLIDVLDVTLRQCASLEERLDVIASAKLGSILERLH